MRLSISIVVITLISCFACAKEYEKLSDVVGGIVVTNLSNGSQYVCIPTTNLVKYCEDGTIQTLNANRMIKDLSRKLLSRKTMRRHKIVSPLPNKKKEK